MTWAVYNDKGCSRGPEAAQDLGLLFRESERRKLVKTVRLMNIANMWPDFDIKV